MCDICRRARRTCICRWITPVAGTVEVLILQHPLEVDNVKGSGRLLHLCLPGSRLVIGETFDEAALRELLYAPFAGTGSADSSSTMRHTLLLYPASDTRQDGIVALPAAVADAAPHRLVILDATWRKSRKQLYCNPLLQQLPRLTLRDTGRSRYRIRKAHRPDQLSTFEATCQALMQLEGGGAQYQAILTAFDGFVAQQMEYGFAATDAGPDGRKRHVRF